MPADGWVRVQTHYRWREEYGGLKVDRAGRIKDLERENAWCGKRFQI